jgi:putative mRNA 3-end processing factor
MTIENAKITGDGAILMGELFCADGMIYDDNRKFFAISHMHSDHANMLKRCLYNGTVFMTPWTAKLLEAVYDDNYSDKTTKNNTGRKNIKILDYGQSEEIQHNGVKETITFHHSNHNLGASQIEIKTEKGTKIVYSGDVQKDDEPPEEIDTLVVDSTHGHPRYSKYNDETSDEKKFLDTITQALNGETPRSIVVHGHEGKLQEAMSLISNHSALEQFPFFATGKDIRLADVYREEEEFKKIRKKIHPSEDSAVEDWINDESNDPCIEFTASCRKRTYEEMGKAFSVILTDRCDQYTHETLDGNTLVMITNAHASHVELLDYVKKAEPKEVIVDCFRSKQGMHLKNMLVENGFVADGQPENNG